jgi:hypothetical protein
MRRQAGQGQRQQRRIGAGKGRDRQAFGEGGAHQAVAGVRHQGGARVRHQGHPSPLSQHGENAADAAVLVVVVQGGEAGCDAIGGKQARGDAGILAQHEVRRLQRRDRPDCHVTEVADRR